MVATNSLRQELKGRGFTRTGEWKRADLGKGGADAGIAAPVVVVRGFLGAVIELKLGIRIGGPDAEL